MSTNLNFIGSHIMRITELLLVKKNYKMTERCPTMTKTNQHWKRNKVMTVCNHQIQHWQLNWEAWFTSTTQIKHALVYQHLLKKISLLSIPFRSVVFQPVTAVSFDIVKCIHNVKSNAVNLRQSVFVCLKVGVSMFVSHPLTNLFKLLVNFHWSYWCAAKTEDCTLKWFFRFPFHALSPSILKYLKVSPGFTSVRSKQP